jgi:hypothetical protein
MPPFNMQSGIALGAFAWAFSWLGTFKVIAILLGTTALAHQSGPLAFILCFALPLVPVRPNRDPGSWIDRMALFAGTALTGGATNLTIWTPLLLHITKGSWNPDTFVSLLIHCVLLPHVTCILLQCPRIVWKFGVVVLGRPVVWVC